MFICEIDTRSARLRSLRRAFLRRRDADGASAYLRSNPVSENPMKVIHKDQQHLVSLSSDEVALLLNLCFAGACSDLLPSTTTAKTRVKRFLGQVQECLLDTAQKEWLAKRGLGQRAA